MVNSVPTPREPSNKPAVWIGKPRRLCMNGVTNAMVPNRTTPITTINTVPLTKLRSLKSSKRTNGSGVVSE